MGNALRMGLAGGLMGAMSGAHQQWEQTQYEIKTERLRAARQLEAEALAKINAENEAKKDERDFEQSKVLEGIKAENRQKIEGEKINASDRRADKLATARVEAAQISASKPRGEGTKAKPQLFQNDAGEQIWVTPGDSIPAGYFRASSSGGRKAPPPSTTTPKTEPAAPLPEPIIIDPPKSGARTAAPSAPVPKVGTVMQGYRFKGGDPASQSSWERI